MQLFRLMLVIVLICAATPFLCAQKVTMYSMGSGSLMTQAQMDQLLLIKNESLKGTDFLARIEEKSRRTKGDTAIIEVTISVANSAAHQSTEKRKQWMGKALPPFQLIDLQGNPISSADFSGKPVVINFWFTACIPCIAEMPELNRLAKKYKSKDVAFLSMTYETKAAVDSFLQRRNFNFLHIPNAKAYIEQFTTDYPVSLFVDRTGTIRFVKGGMPILYKPRQEMSENSKVDADEFEESLKIISR